MRHRSHPGRVIVVIATLAALVLAACGGGGGDDAAPLGEAFQNTFEGSFAFDATVNADGAAREELLAEDENMGAVLDNLRFAGRVGDSTFALTIGAEGSELLEVLWPNDNTVYLRGNLQSLAELGGEQMPPPDQLVASLGQLGLPPELQTVAEEFVRGNFVGIVLPEDMGEGGQAAGLPVPVDVQELERLKAEFEERYETPQDFVDEFVESETSEADEGTRHDLTIRLRALMEEVATMAEEAESTSFSAEDIRAELDNMPETISGMAVTVADGVVTQAQIQVLEVARSVQEALPEEEATEEIPEGSVDVTINLSDHGNIEPVTQPPDAATIPAEQLIQLVMGMMLGGGGLGG